MYTHVMSLSMHLHTRQGQPTANGQLPKIGNNKCIITYSVHIHMMFESHWHLQNQIQCKN